MTQPLLDISKIDFVAISKAARTALNQHMVEPKSTSLAMVKRHWELVEHFPRPSVNKRVVDTAKFSISGNLRVTLTQLVSNRVSYSVGLEVYQQSGWSVVPDSVLEVSLNDTEDTRLTALTYAKKLYKGAVGREAPMNFFANPAEYVASEGE